MAGSRARDAVRRAVGALIVLTLLGAAVALGTGAAGNGAGAAAPATAAPATAAPGPGTAAPGGTTTPDDPRTPTPVPARTIPPSPTPIPTQTPTPTPTPAPGGRGGSGRAGVALTARPHVDSTFLMAEVVTLPAPVTQVVLRPPVIADAGALFARQRPAAIDLQVRAGDQVVTVPPGPVRGEVTLRWATPTARLDLRYRLTGVSVASRPSTAGRSLAAIGPLLHRAPGGLPVTVEVRGPTVLSLTCPQLPLARTACGSGAAPRFRTAQPLPLDRARVLVQFDRPRPRAR